MDAAKAMRNVLQQLQEEPKRYKLFGVYWWAIKALLKRYYGPDQLYMLDSYIDQETAAMIPLLGLDAVLAAAFTEYEFNATYPHMDNQVENPDGELVSIFDEDAGL